jgi:hypothetical protein
MKQSKSIVTVNEHFGWSFSQHPVVNFSQTHLASVYAGKLALSGQKVTVLARNNRLNELKEKGLFEIKK